jgi:hypothetical protein
MVSGERLSPLDSSLFHSENDIVPRLFFDFFKDTNNKSSGGDEPETEKRPKADLSSIPNFQLNPEVVSPRPVLSSRARTRCPRAPIFLSDLLASFASPIRLASFTCARISAPCPCCSVRVVVVVCGLLCLPHVSWWMSQKPSIANPSQIHSGSDSD